MAAAMQAHHRIKVEVERDLIIFELCGFFDKGALGPFMIERKAAFARLRCRPNQHLTLCDVSRCQIQSQEMFAHFQRLLNEPAARSRKMAFIVGSSLARMQVRRLLQGREDVPCFETDRAARAWLFEADDAPVAA